MLTNRIQSRCSGFCDGLTTVRGTLICALVVVLLDVVIGGSHLFSLLICPIWFLVAVVRVLWQRPNLRVAAARVLIPLVTFLLVLANYSVQRSIAMAHATQLILACEQYRTANGVYPEQLADVVPRYLSSIPMAKYCLFEGEFRYFVGEDYHMLVWCEIPPFGRRIYNFERGTWSYLD